jgi:hypothetical protein
MPRPRITDRGPFSHSSGSTPEGQRRNHQAGITNNAEDQRTIEIRDGRRRIKAADGIAPLDRSASLADVISCFNTLLARLKGG